MGIRRVGMGRCRRDRCLSDISSLRRVSSFISTLYSIETHVFAGLFMGLVVGLLLFSILYVGISAVSSIQVSYAAFDKEMGPAAQKKQQQ